MASWSGASATWTTAAWALHRAHRTRHNRAGSQRRADDHDEIGRPEGQTRGPLVTSNRCPPGTTPQPIPLVIAGMPSASTKRSAASSAPSAQTSVPMTSTGRRACASRWPPAPRHPGRAAPLPDVSGPRRAPGHRREELVHRHVDEDRPTVRRPGEGEGLVSAGPTSAALAAVQARFATGARIGGWSSSWRLPAPTASPGRARRDDHRCAENRAWATALTPFVTPGPAVRTANPDPGQLAGRLGREGGGLLVPHVEQAHRRVGLDRAVTDREDVRPRRGEDRLNPVRAGGRHRVPPCLTHDTRARLAHTATLTGAGDPRAATPAEPGRGRSRGRSRTVGDGHGGGR